jgi:DNA-binding transcriptional MerR regulator
VVNCMIQTASSLSGQEHGAGLEATSDSADTEMNISKDSIGIEAESIGQASLSGRVLLFASSITDKKNTLGNSSKMRSSGLTGVPKAGSMAPSDAAYDLFFLEKKLAELGLMTGSGGSSYRNNGNTLTSALGESFMLLSTSSSRTKGGRMMMTARNAVTMPLGPRDALRVTPSNPPKLEPETNTMKVDSAGQTKQQSSSSSNSPSNVPNSTSVTGPYGGMKKGVLAPSLRPPGNTGGNKGVGTFWLPNPIDILTWRGIKASTPCVDDLKEKPSKDYSVYENSQLDLNWNDDQSVYGPSVRGESDRKSISDSQTISASAIQGYFISSQTGNPILDEDKMDNERDINITNGTLRESELRLLQSIKRLGDENFSLLQRIDLLSAVEARNLDLHKEMTLFKKEYQERFCRLKEVLREFQRKNSRDGNSRTFGFEFNTIIGAQPGEVFDGRDDMSNSKSNDGDGKTQGIIKEKNRTDELENVRQQQLERTVLALVKRLEEVSV